MSGLGENLVLFPPSGLIVTRFPMRTTISPNLWFGPLSTIGALATKRDPPARRCRHRFFDAGVILDAIRREMIVPDAIDMSGLEGKPVSEAKICLSSSRQPAY